MVKSLRINNEEIASNIIQIKQKINEFEFEITFRIASILSMYLYQYVLFIEYFCIAGRHNYNFDECISEARFYNHRIILIYVSGFQSPFIKNI